ncbi:MAG: WYL domain-containing protein [Bacillota bacterium]
MASGGRGVRSKRPRTRGWRTESKVERLRLIERELIGAGRQGRRAEEIARAVGVCRQTVYRDLELLQRLEMPLWNPARGRWAVHPERYLGTLRLSTHEAVALFFAVRLLARTADEQNPHAIRALRLLARLFPEPVQTQALQAADQLARRPPNAEFVNALEQLTMGWIHRRKVAFSYQAARGRRPHPYVLHPYFLEPVGPSLAAYVLGYEESYFHAVLTLKLERIRSAVMLEESFPEPDDFDPVKALETAWGIMWSSETTRVKLRFSPRVTRRVKESQWHPSQRIEELPGGGCLLTLEVGNTLELQPWIRSWGPEVEVLEPAELREAVAREAAATAALYGVTVTDQVSAS